MIRCLGLSFPIAIVELCGKVAHGRKIGRSSVQHHAIFDSRGQPSIELIAKCCFVVSRECAEIVEVDDVSRNTVIFLHGELLNLLRGLDRHVLVAEHGMESL